MATIKEERGKGMRNHAQITLARKVHGVVHTIKKRKRKKKGDLIADNLIICHYQFGRTFKHAQNVYQIFSRSDSRFLSKDRNVAVFLE